MLIEVSVENFLSIKDRITLSLEASASKNLPNNKIKFSKKEELLKSAVIYGSNASGKTNLIKAIVFMWGMVKSSHGFNAEINIPRTAFKLDAGFSNKPSIFELMFIYKKVKYKYCFSCDDKNIVDEYLYYWPNGRESLVFERKNSNDFKFTCDKKQQELIRKQMTGNVLYLSRATQLGYGKTKFAYDFVVNNVLVNPQVVDMTSKQIYERTDLKNKIIAFLQKADFGGINDVLVNKEIKKVDGVEFKIDKGNTVFNPLKQVEKDFYGLKFIHKTRSGSEIEFGLGEESGGTIKTIFMLGPILDVLENGKTLFIDELELSLHPNITRLLVGLFNSKNNKNGAQLIFTTHDTDLLDNQLFRRDQIYVCSKKPNENTTLSSFLDFDLREEADFRKAYLDGRVGGIPFIDETTD